MAGKIIIQIEKVFIMKKKFILAAHNWQEKKSAYLSIYYKIERRKP